MSKFAKHSSETEKQFSSIYLFKDTTHH